jgi:hypothetical protein
MQQTSNYALKKPEQTDVVNIEDINANFDTVDTELAAGAAKMQSAVADLTAFKAINTTVLPDKTIILCENLGLYRYDSSSTATADDFFIIAPTTGGGRWILLAETAYGYSPDTGTANTFVLTFPGLTAYYTGLMVWFKAVNANTGACTINVNGLGAKSLVRPTATALVTGDITAGTLICAVYDGTNFQLVGLLSTNLVHLTATQTLTNKTLASPILTTPKFANGGFIADANGNELIKFTTVASAVNELTVSNAATGGDPSIAATGGDANIDINMIPKGTGRLQENGNNVVLAMELNAVVAGGTGTVITLTVPNYTALVNYRLINFIASANNGGAATTININGLGVKNLYKPGTTTAPTLIAGKAYTIWYNGTSFFIKASAEGTVTADKVLAPYTFSNDYDTGIVGTGVDNGPSEATTVNLTTEGDEYVIQAGYHSGLRKIKAAITNLAASVIKAGSTVGGILGTFTADATATAYHMLSGVTAYVNGNKVTGNIASKGAATYNPSTSPQTIADGQYLSGEQTIAATTGTATVSDVASGKTFNSANGIGLVGTAMKVASGAATSSSGTAQFYDSSTGLTANLYYVTVSGLDFTPSKILVYYNNGGYPMVTSFVPGQVAGRGCIGISGGYTQKIDLKSYSSASSAEVYYGGFKLPVGYLNAPCTWIAIP